jgi:hypothetical protein
MLQRTDKLTRGGLTQLTPQFGNLNREVTLDCARDARAAQDLSKRF